MQCIACNYTVIVHYTKRIGVKGCNLIFKMSVALHGKQAQVATVLIDTTVQEKNIPYPTDAKLAIKIINRLRPRNKGYFNKSWFICLGLLLVLLL
jgi:IS5 family transposase